LTEPQQPTPVPAWVLIGVFAVLGLIWGSSFLWIKVALRTLEPQTLIAYRIGLGAGAMLLYLRWRGHRLPRTPGELGPLAGLGLIATALPFFLISWGEQHLDSGTASVLNSLTPIFTMIIAVAVLRSETVGRMRALGVITGFGGAVLLASREFALRGDPLAVVAAVAVTVAAFSYAVGANLSRHLLGSMPRDVVAAGNLTFAALFAVAFAVVTGADLAPPATAEAVVAVVWLGLLGSFAAFVMLYFLFDHAGATVTSTVGYLFPVVGVTLGVIFLGELLDWRLVVGAGLVVVSFGLIGLRYDQVVRWINRGGSRS
jgi:drug/metabolite transporter (DMT)-like permease